MSTPILLEITDGTARITLNRPDKGNALDQPMADALLAAAIKCANDPAVRCVVLTGAGKMFSVGGDIGAFALNSDGIAPFLAQLAGTLHQALSQFAAMQKPLITLVNGTAAGAGLSMAISGDVVLADPNAMFTTAYLGIGLTPDGGMTWLLPRLVGMRRAQEMIITNARVSAEKAAEIGLVTRLAAPGALMDEGDVLARQLADGAVGAMGQARRLLHDSSSSGFASQMDRELAAITAAGSGPEGRAGIEAFLAKRKPDFENGG
ncbi:putative acyl-CoA hydratase [Sulfitobacter noctilucae]|uniref:enoyl-CoA hydratase/isomerase family protein n=1 Tax=Sulfitobacter noctilucae TaxID=1342302 RepID=UPI00046A6739|nr:enoyl-CoA hydratase-related protein [Sulfitobacter noctilucae]KIN65565.1 putative acyl-CoA hydratase [Sulfitobacter noctilucae]